MKRRIITMILTAMLLLSLAVPTLAADVNDYPVVYTTFNTAAVENYPDYYPDFTVGDSDLLVQAVTTYHWNYGRGSTPGTISIYDWDDNLIGTWNATGRSGQGGVPNANWDIFPNVVLKAGTRYYFVDSDGETWSYNSQSGGEGFVEVRGTASISYGTENGRIEGQTFVFTDRNGVDFRASLDAFASSVINFTHGDPWRNADTNTDPKIALGLPDADNSDSSTGDLCLGGGGVLTLGFDVEIYDGEGIDLYVFEVGGDVEDTKVEVSPDLVNWYEVGTATGRTAGVDFNGKVPAGTGIRYVRLTDLYTAARGSWPGADIDAVCGIHTRAPSGTGSPSAGISVKVNGRTVQWTDAQPFVNSDNRTMVPLRAVGEALGLDVDWDGTAREAIFTNGTKTIYFPINSKYYRTETGDYGSMDTAAVIVNSRTFAPIRYLAEYFGYNVDWDGANKTVLITGSSGSTGLVWKLTNVELYSRPEPYEWSNASYSFSTEMDDDDRVLTFFWNGDSEYIKEGSWTNYGFECAYHMSYLPETIRPGETVYLNLWTERIESRGTNPGYGDGDNGGVSLNARSRGANTPYLTSIWYDAKTDDNWSRSGIHAHHITGEAETARAYITFESEKITPGDTVTLEMSIIPSASSTDAKATWTYKLEYTN